VTEVARGNLTVVYVSRAPGEKQYHATRIPDEVDALIEVAPPDLLS